MSDQPLPTDTEETIRLAQEKLRTARKKQKEAKKIVDEAVEQAKIKVNDAEQTLEDGKKDIEELTGKDPGVTTIAGYTITELIKAPIKPPEPHLEQSKVDPDTEKQLKEDFKKAEKKVKDIKSRVEKAK